MARTHNNHPVKGLGLVRLDSDNKGRNAGTTAYVRTGWRKTQPAVCALARRLNAVRRRAGVLRKTPSAEREFVRLNAAMTRRISVDPNRQRLLTLMA